MQENWEVNEFCGFDPRVARSVAEAAQAVSVKRGLSHSASVGGRLRQATGRAFASQKSTPDILQARHRQATVERCSEHEVVLVPNDTCVFNYSGHRATKGLGPVNDHNTGRGVFCHSAMP